jgi:hypothetical protein
MPMYYRCSAVHCRNRARALATIKRIIYSDGIPRLVSRGPDLRATAGHLLPSTALAARMAMPIWSDWKSPREGRVPVQAAGLANPSDDSGSRTGSPAYHAALRPVSDTKTPRTATHPAEYSRQPPPKCLLLRWSNSARDSASRTTRREGSPFRGLEAAFAQPVRGVRILGTGLRPSVAR